MKKFLILFLLVFICCLTTVNAADNITNSTFQIDDSQEAISAGESVDNPITNPDDLWLKFFNTAEGTTADIYIANGTYECNRFYATPKNVTFIGQGENTILKGISTFADSGVAPSEKNYAISYTFVNLTFVGGTNDLSRSCKFINCTIVDSLTFSKYYYDHPDTLNIRRITTDYYALRTYFYEFDNCIFKNYNGNNPYLNLYQFGCAKFFNCNFTNITADSIICYNNNVSYEKVKNYLLRLGWSLDKIERISYDGIYFNNCFFNDSKYVAVTDSFTDLNISISNCSDIKSEYYGVFLSDDNLHHYYSLPIPSNATLTVHVDDIKYSDDFIVKASFSVCIKDNVIVVINKNKYSVSMDRGNGSLVVKNNFNAGNYIVDARLDNNNCSDVSNFTINPLTTRLISDVVKATYNDNKYLVITLKDIKDNNMDYYNIIVKIDNQLYSKTTDDKGQVKILTSSYVPGTHSVFIVYEGDTNYFKSAMDSKITISKATPKIAAKKKTFRVKVKTKKYYITLKTNQNKTLKKAKVTLKVKGKTYKATTNSRGKATFKITKLTKRGTFKAKITYKGNAYYKGISKTIKIKIK